MNVRRSVLVPYPAESVFDVIEQAEHYPQFMPWCVAATILERSDDWVAGKVDFSFFEIRFDGDWRLTRLGDLGCKVELDASYEIGDGLLDRVARPAVDLVARAMIDAFVRRAEHIHREMP